MDREKVIKGLECHRIDNNHRINCADCPYYVDDDNHIRCVNDLHDDAIAMLKEQEHQKQHWLKQIADTQLLNAPCDWQNEDQKLYATGVWDGLQIAWDILTEGDKK